MGVYKAARMDTHPSTSKRISGMKVGKDLFLPSSLPKRTNTARERRIRERLAKEKSMPDLRVTCHWDDYPSLESYSTTTTDDDMESLLLTDGDRDIYSDVSRELYFRDASDERVPLAVCGLTSQEKEKFTRSIRRKRVIIYLKLICMILAILIMCMGIVTITVVGILWVALYD